jgi:hypothetical protein
MIIILMHLFCFFLSQENDSKAAMLAEPVINAEWVFVSEISWYYPPPELEKSYFEGDGKVVILFPSNEYFLISAGFFKTLNTEQFSACDPCGFAVRHGTWRHAQQQNEIIIESEWAYRNLPPVDPDKFAEREVVTCIIEHRNEEGKIPASLVCGDESFFNDPDLDIESLRPILDFARATIDEEYGAYLDFKSRCKGLVSDLESQKEAVATAAAEALVQIGPPALPFIFDASENEKKYNGKCGSLPASSDYFKSTPFPSEALDSNGVIHPEQLPPGVREAWNIKVEDAALYLVATIAKGENIPYMLHFCKLMAEDDNGIDATLPLADIEALYYSTDPPGKDISWEAVAEILRRYGVNI